MNQRDDRRKSTPRERFRDILSADQDDRPSPEVRKPAVVNLPKAGAGTETDVSEPVLRTPEKSVPVARSRPSWMPTFWTVGGVLSVLANLVLLTMLISLWTGAGRLNPAGPSAGALLGVYTSLEQLAESHIRATVPVQTNLNLDASIPVQSTTKITLAQDVFMQGAHVTIDTALFNIDAPANITLPAGTSLDVTLDMILPMNSDVPIAVDVPVDIAVGETDLLGAIRGLQQSLQPVLCATSPGAMLPDGKPICR